MAAKKETTAVAEAKTTAVGMAMDFSADAGMGMEGADKASFAIPFLTVLQGLSPQLESVEGARPGLFINTITNELYENLLVIPCAFQRRFLRWAPRDAGGGYKGEYNPIDVETGKVEGLVLNSDGRYTIEGDLLGDTRNHFVLFKNKAGSWSPALISLASTQIKKSKRWMSLIQGIELVNAAGKAFNPPSFSHIYLLKSVKEENSKGKWHGIDVSVHGVVEDADVYAKAKDFHNSVVSGSVEVSPPQADDAVGGDNEKF